MVLQYPAFKLLHAAVPYTETAFPLALPEAGYCSPPRVSSLENSSTTILLKQHPSPLVALILPTALSLSEMIFAC